MKLKNKRTGEIGTLVVDGAYKFVTNFAVEDDEMNRLGEYNSLAELNAEWEDYEEPFSTSFYTIVDGKIKHCIFYSKRVAGCPSDAWAYLKDDGRERIKQLKEVGLYFETREEAEQALEKLKAVKRLKDKGFKSGMDLTGVYGTTMIYGIEITASKYNELDDETRADLDLLFGGEE